MPWCWERPAAGDSLAAKGLAPEAEGLAAAQAGGADWGAAPGERGGKEAGEASTCSQDGAAECVKARLSSGIRWREGSPASVSRRWSSAVGSRSLELTEPEPAGNPPADAPSDRGEEATAPGAGSRIDESFRGVISVAKISGIAAWMTESLISA